MNSAKQIEGLRTLSESDSSNVEVAPDSPIGPGVVFAGPGIKVQSQARIDASAIIDANVTIGRGAWVRTGAVVLQSVPANAIVEGNPARVVGYVSSQDKQARPAPRLIDARGFTKQERPSSVFLGVGQCELRLLPKFDDVRGSLVAGEIPRELPFVPERFFAVLDVPTRELRGEHAHKECQQFLVCVNGSCRVLLDDGMNRCEVVLEQPDVGVYMPPMIWGTQFDYSSDAVLLVFASHKYDSSDYIRTYDEFMVQLSKEKDQS